MAWILLVVYCLLILAASLAGGWIPLAIRLTHRRMQIAVSLVAGVMLGVGLLHMLPHALLEAPDAYDQVFYWVLAGFLVMFFIERFFCFHHHDVPHEPTAPQHDSHADHDPNLCCQSAPGGAGHRLTWSGAAIGLSLHTVIAGVALAASVEVETQGGHVGAMAGFGTFLVIFLHKPFDAMTLGTLMAVGGWSMTARHAVNAVFALMIPLGVVLFHFGLGHTHDDGGSRLLAYALGFSSGTFLCIAMSDLLPELQFHRHDRIALSLAMILGLAAAWAIGLIETGGHGHQPHDQDTPAVEVQGDYAGSHPSGAGHQHAHH